MFMVSSGELLRGAGGITGSICSTSGSDAWGNGTVVNSY